MKSLLMVWFLLGDSMKEQWKKIKGYENYLISDRGRVFSFYTKKFRKPQKDTYGYLQVDFYKNGVRKNHTIHRLVALAFLLNPENKRTVNHIDGIKTNNFVHNLEWATDKENIRHAWDNGLKKPKKGIKNGRAKLLEKEVLEIRRIFATGEYTKTALAKMFCVGQTLIGFIVRRENWKHI